MTEFTRRRAAATPLSATVKQVNYALSLMQQVGVGGSEVVDGQTSRKYGIPQGAPLKEVLESLGKREIGSLIDKLVGE